MDSRIEELAEIIQERAKQTADAIAKSNTKAPAKDIDRYKTSRLIESMALDILTELHQFRLRHREDYFD